jgi:hypothetical protein
MTTREKLSSAIKKLKQSEEYGFLMDAIRDARGSHSSLKRVLEIKHGLPLGIL